VYCTECGTALNDNTKFCSSCGFRTGKSEEVTAAEKSPNQVDNQIKQHIQVSILEFSEENTRKYKYYAVALFLIWYAAFHDLGLGINHTDVARVNCDFTTIVDDPLDDFFEDLSKECSEYKNKSTAIVLISFAGAVFCFWRASNPSNEERKNKGRQVNLPKRKNEIPVEFPLSPLEKEKKDLSDAKSRVTIMAVAILLMPLAYLGAINDDGYYAELSVLDAINVENCLDSSKYPGFGPVIDWQIDIQESCEEVAGNATNYFFIITLTSSFFVFISILYAKKQRTIIRDIEEERENQRYRG